MKFILTLALAMCLLLIAPAFHSSTNQFTANAGRTLTGGFCVCGCPACICDPGEIEMECPDGIQQQQPVKSKQKDRNNGEVPSELITILALAWFVFQRMRVAL